MDTPCGDGVVQGDEACDDGDLVPGDGCDETCHIEEGWSCLGEPSQCDTICGDGRVMGDEVCDDGNKQDGDGCSSDCRSLEQCGDGKINQGEGCDDGANGDPCDGCLDNCMVHNNVCGDGYVCGDEVCDDGNGDNTDDYLNSCELAWCGDGYVHSSDEECDDGNGVNTDGCLNTCVAATCGDGVVWYGQEECDDGNTDDTDACLSSCVSANCGNTLQRVGLKDPNPWDLYDMLGGVWEWCHDWYENYPSTAVEDPWGSTPSSGRMVRGGSWYNPAANARAAQRLPVDPSSVFINVGIRPVRTLNP